MLPRSAERRWGVYDRVLGAGCDLHGALEGLVARDGDDLLAIEDLLVLEELTTEVGA